MYGIEVNRSIQYLRIWVSPEYTHWVMAQDALSQPMDFMWDPTGGAVFQENRWNRTVKDHVRELESRGW